MRLVALSSTKEGDGESARGWSWGEVTLMSWRREFAPTAFSSCVAAASWKEGRNSYERQLAPIP
jgi:hypothetical protein